MYSKAVALVFLVTPSLAAAQISSEICKPMLASGLRDVNNTLSSAKKLQRIQDIVCQSKYSTHSSADEVDISGSFNFFNVLEGSPDDSVTAENYSEKWTEFCSLSSSDVVSDNYLNSHVSTINTELAASFTDCVDKVVNGGGLQAWVEPSPTLQSLTLWIRKHGIVAVENFASIPALSSCTPDLLAATAANPYTFSGSQSFVCDRGDASKLAVISGNTQNDGSLFDKPINLPGLDETITDVMMRLDEVERRGVPRGTIAYFEGPCPSPQWQEFTKLQGRYAVGVNSDGDIGEQVGIALTDRENRPVGKHDHGITFSKKNEKASSGSSEHHASSASTKTLPAGKVSGTNAPYVQLSACIRK